MKKTNSLSISLSIVALEQNNKLQKKRYYNLIGKVQMKRLVFSQNEATSLKDHQIMHTWYDGDPRDDHIYKGQVLKLEENEKNVPLSLLIIH